MSNPNSRLGWRILYYVVQSSGREAMAGKALSDSDEIVEMLDGEFGQEHLAITELLGCIVSDEEPTPDEMTKAIEATGLSWGDLLLNLDSRHRQLSQVRRPTKSRRSTKVNLRFS